MAPTSVNNMSTIPEDGVYASKSHGTKFNPDRDVYIQNGTVRLVYDDCKYTWGFHNFFNVNTLGKRLRDLPNDFDIYK